MGAEASVISYQLIAQKDDVLNYTITIENNGNVDLNSITVNDILQTLDNNDLTLDDTGLVFSVNSDESEADAQLKPAGVGLMEEGDAWSGAAPNSVFATKVAPRPGWHPAAPVAPTNPEPKREPSANWKTPEKEAWIPAWLRPLSVGQPQPGCNQLEGSRTNGRCRDGDRLPDTAQKRFAANAAGNAAGLDPDQSGFHRRKIPGAGP